MVHKSVQTSVYHVRPRDVTDGIISRQIWDESEEVLQLQRHQQHRPARRRQRVSTLNIIHHRYFEDSKIFQMI